MTSLTLVANFLYKVMIGSGSGLLSIVGMLWIRTKITWIRILLRLLNVSFFIKLQKPHINLYVDKINGWIRIPHTSGS